MPRTRNEAHKLIEETMLAANVCAAGFIAGGNIRRCSACTKARRRRSGVALQNYLRALGLGLHLSDDPTPGEIQTIALATKDRPDAAQIHTMLLRSMQQAVYTAANAGHFGLAYDAYTHFTSPIRRYPDLLVHRVIKALLAEALPPGAQRRTRVPEARRGGKGRSQPAKPLSQEMELWEVAGAHCSANERRADEASRDVEAWLKCRFMREHLGEEFAGTVSAVTSFGLFVTLDALYVEGLVHITELGGEYYRFDEVRQELRGERTGVRYAVGARVRVQVSRVDLDGRKIDFRLVRDGEDERPSPARAASARGAQCRRRTGGGAGGRPCGQGRRARSRARRRIGRGGRQAGPHAAQDRAAHAREPRAYAITAARGRRAVPCVSISSPARSAARSAAAAAARPRGRGGQRGRAASAGVPHASAARRGPAPTGRRSSRPARRRCRRWPAGIAGRVDVGRRRGAAITLPEPLSSTTQPKRQPAAGGSEAVGLHLGTPLPSRRAASSGCGVSTRHLAARGARPAAVLQAAVGGHGVEGIGVQHQACGVDSSAGRAARTASRRRSRRPRCWRQQRAARRHHGGGHQFGPWGRAGQRRRRAGCQ